MNYQFGIEHISQHIVKYGVDVRPAFVLKQEKTKLQDYCNWLIEQFPLAFETLVAGPSQLRVQKNFTLPTGKRIDMPTFILTNRGPLFTLPHRIFIDEPHNLDIPDRDRIFRKALDEMRNRFLDRIVLRVGVIHEFVFDTGDIDSLEIIASALKNDVWKESVKNLNIRLEVPREGKNINLEIKPTYLQRGGRGGPGAPQQNAACGIIVNVDINNRQIKDNLTKAQVNDILAFANDYIPEELINFLNNED